MNWLDRQLRPLDVHRDRPGVILDVEALLDDVTVAALGTPWQVDGYLSLRRAWEEHGRRPSGSPRPIFVVRSPDFTQPESLPWDIEQAAVVVVVTWSVPPEWRPVARQLSPELRELLVEIAASGQPATQVTSEILRRGYGVVLPAPNSGAELDAIVRLVASHLVPKLLWDQIRALVDGPLAAALCQPTPDFGPLQQAWAEWLVDGENARAAGTLRDAGAGLASLFASGLMRPEPITAQGLPIWSRIGAVQPGPSERLAGLLDAPPGPWPVQTATDWITTASWWGDVRAALAEATPAPAALAERAWQVWGQLDGAFASWMRSSYGLLFSSTREHPVTLDQVAPFLARRYAANGRRQLLVLVDGMAFAQWSLLRRTLAIGIADAGGCFAMCPTLTSVSRQAVFAGTVPLQFADSLWTTSREETADNVPALGRAKIVGLVVLAVDEMMHGARVFGDGQMNASLVAWARLGFLSRLLKDADHAGFEVWFTADHGNIEATPSGRVMEGPLVDHAGTRVRLYENRVLRDTARAEGLVWDPPILPEGKAPLFAPARTGYHSGGRRVTHGGLSLDEVIVPFARVVPR
jgi:hypothetical protein